MDIKKLVASIVIVLIVFLSISYLSYPLLGSDSGFYLAYAREFYKGNIYFIDIATSYNPLAIVILGIPYLFSAHPDPRFEIAKAALVRLLKVLRYKAHHHALHLHET